VENECVAEDLEVLVYGRPRHLRIVGDVGEVKLTRVALQSAATWRKRLKAGTLRVTPSAMISSRRYEPE
jgi:hypothetical protein